jgi:outer membrane protein assembly factor BamB
MAGKNVYISCASSDTSLLDIVSAALDAWEVVYTSLGQQTNSAMVGQMMLPQNAQAAIRQAEVFLRLCTAATASSASMAQELHFFRALEVEDRSKRRGDRRTLINLILDDGYQREPFDDVTLFITTAGKTRALWLDELARSLGVATVARRLSRRSAVVLGLATGVTLISATAAGGLLVRNQRDAVAAQEAATESAFGPVDKSAGFAGWTQSVSQNFVSSTGFDANPTISVTSDGTSLYALAPDTIQALTPRGDLLWSSTAFPNIQTPTPGLLEIPPPYAGNQVLVFQHTDAQDTNNLAVVDIQSRSLLWHAAVVNGNYSLPAGPVTVVGTSLYCLFPLHNDWSVCAFELRTGHVKWSYSIGLGVPHPGVTYSGGRLYIGDPYRCTCLDAETGKKIWQQHLRTTVVATVVVAGDLVLLGGLDGYFYALEASSGKLRWRTNLSAPVSAQAVAAGGAVYVGDVDGYLWALDQATGRIYWRVFAGGNEIQDAGTSEAVIVYPPVVDRNLVAVAAGDTLSAVDLVSGTRRWQFKTQASNSNTRGMATGPLLIGGYFVVGDSQNHVIGVNP